MSAMNEKFADASPKPESAGAMLAAARNGQGLDVEEMSNRLRLSVGQIEALENDQYDRLAGPTFIRGIIRSYAKSLLIDPQRALDAYSRLAPKTAIPAIDVPSQNIRLQPGAAKEGYAFVKGGLLLLAAAIIGAGAWLSYTAPGIVTGKSAVIPAAKLAQDVSPRSAALAPSPSPVESTPSTPVPPPAVAGTQAESVKAPAVQAAQQPVISPGQPVLRFSFKEDAWLEVEDSTGRLIFSQLNAAGSEQVLTGKPPFALVVGNAAHVELTYDDKAVDLKPHIKGNVARLTLK